MVPRIPWQCITDSGQRCEDTWQCLINSWAMVPKIPWQCLTDSGQCCEDTWQCLINSWAMVPRIPWECQPNYVRQLVDPCGTHNSRVHLISEYLAASKTQKLYNTSLLFVKLTKKYDYPDSNGNGTKMKGKLCSAEQQPNLHCVMQFLQIKTLKISNTILFSLQSTTGRQKQPRRQGGFCGSHVGII